MKSKKTIQLDPTLSEVLLKAIADSGMSQYRLSKESGVGTPAINRFVNGQRTITLESAEKLCKVLGLHLVSKKTE